MQVLLSALLISVSAAAPDGGTPASLRLHSFEVPRAIEQVEVAGGAVSLGIPVELSAVRSRASAEELYAHFLDEFHRRHLYVPPPKDLTPVLANPSLTALDPVAMVAYTVILQPAPDHTVTVIMARADLKRRGTDETPLPIPLVPDAEGLVRTRVESTEVIAFESARSAAELQAFYAAALPRDGWASVAPGRFRRADAEARISVRAQPAGKQAVTVVIGPPPPEASDDRQP